MALSVLTGLASRRHTSATAPVPQPATSARLRTCRIRRRTTSTSAPRALTSTPPSPLMQPTRRRALCRPRSSTPTCTLVQAPAPSTSSIGFEVTNGRAFKPGAPTYYPVVSSDYSWVTNAATGVVEASFPKSAFMTTELGVTGFVPGNDYVVLGLSQKPWPERRRWLDLVRTDPTWRRAPPRADHPRRTRPAQASSAFAVAAPERSL